jgi:1-deoxy-D-xylulose-5-phosphate reductoisomerase
MEAHQPREVESLDDALATDLWAREKAESFVHALAK